MLLGLWLSKSLNQVRGVMVTGASCLLALSSISSRSVQLVTQLICCSLTARLGSNL